MDQPVEATRSVVEKISEVEENKVINEEELKLAWEDYITERRKANKPYEIVILNQEYQYSNNLITLKLSNPVQIEQLNDFKTDLLFFLRKRLQNFLLDINAIISVQEEKKMIYTSSEKFNYLAKKNPALIDLKQKLGLDVDY
jgi:DNA polymerase III subunit gamma/tau